MGKWYEWKLKIVSIGILAQGAYGWVESYDGGEDGKILIYNLVYFFSTFCVI